MVRLQLSLNVSDLEAAITFYRDLFSTEPAKRRPGYANFSIAEPPLKLVLVESPQAPGSGTALALNHLGIEVDSTDEVAKTAQHLSSGGHAIALEENATCCYALQDKVWIADPDGTPWEIYTVLADAPFETGLAPSGGCCDVQTAPSALRRAIRVCSPSGADE